MNHFHRGRLKMGIITMLIFPLFVWLVWYVEHDSPGCDA